MLLTANTSDDLVELARSGAAEVDGFEIGEYLPVEKLQAYRQALPGWKFYFHGRFVETDRFAAYRRLTDNTFTSLHMLLAPAQLMNFGFRTGVFFPPLTPKMHTRRFIERVLKVKKRLDMPLILENLELVPSPGYRYASDPALIGEVLDQTGCDLLLDIGHARVAASFRGMDTRQYLQSLPLDRVVQIHMSGPRLKGRYLYDAHETLRDEDYALLEWTLERTHPQMLTLEYFQSVPEWQSQVKRLRKMIE
jgi:hypothetical protein